MPRGWTLDTLPKPTDSRVNLRMVPRRTLAALRYNGGWSENLYNEEVTKTEVDLDEPMIIKQQNNSML